MSDRAKGVLAMSSASLIWGFTGYYFRLLETVPPFEILSHRILWSVVICFAIIVFNRRGRYVGKVLLSSKRSILLALAGAALISINWFVFVTAIMSSQAVQASLGYFIFPLVAVLVGSLFFGDRLTGPQWAAILLMAVAVLILMVQVGEATWISLLLAMTFCAYGIVKRELMVDPITSVSADTLLLVPVALCMISAAYLGKPEPLVHLAQGHFGSDIHVSLLLACSGFVTAGPLILMSYATSRLRYTELGLIQFLNPSLQFIVATLAFREPLSIPYGIAFTIIWVALAVYSCESFRLEKYRRKRFSNS